MDQDNQVNLLIDGNKLHFTHYANNLTFGGLKRLVSATPAPVETRVAGIDAARSCTSSDSPASVTPDSIGLHGGIPPAECAPIKSISITLASGQVLAIDASQAQQQYNISSYGLPSLRDWAIQHTQKMHHPSFVFDVAITGSSSLAIDIVFSLFLNPGDACLSEEYVYPHVLECVCRPKGYEMIPVGMDADTGIRPNALLDVLKKRQASGKPMPKLLYTVPIGQNPTGAVIPLDQKQAVYAICKEYNIIIMEDDPYSYLQLGLTTKNDAEQEKKPAAVPGLLELVHGAARKLDSYLSIDTDGRVLRLDSFSKCLAPGYRLGWVSGLPSIVEKIAMATQACTIGANNFCQVIVSEMLNTWGDEGLDAHLRCLQEKYTERAAAMLAAAERSLKGLAEWHTPRAGMFMWFKLLNIEDAMDVFDDLCKAGVVGVPGHVALPVLFDENGAKAKCPYLRLSFTNASPDDIQLGIQRMADVLRKHQSKGGIP